MAASKDDTVMTQVNWGSILGWVDFKEMTREEAEIWLADQTRRIKL